MVTIHDDDGYKSRRLLIINFDFYKTFSFTLLLLDLDYLDDKKNFIFLNTYRYICNKITIQFINRFQ